MQNTRLSITSRIGKLSVKSQRVKKKKKKKARVNISALWAMSLS